VQREHVRPLPHGGDEQPHASERDPRAGGAPGGGCGEEGGHVAYGTTAPPQRHGDAERWRVSLAAWGDDSSVKSSTI
jgi:hypothetical protein